MSKYCAASNCSDGADIADGVKIHHGEITGTKGRLLLGLNQSRKIYRNHPTTTGHK
jgi:hypothetical protein